MKKLTTKYLRWAQGAGGAGWNKHVGKWLRRKANKRLRRLFANELKKTVRV
ncbi:hypothetical protein KKB40_06195 [Patescibacteria group bacterium]|nr:hypothetical protein [Patescibacteria group bacterium]